MREIDFHAVAAAANSDPEFGIAARHWSVVLELCIDARTTEFLIVDGHVRDTDVDGPRSPDRSRVSVRASAEDWDKLLAPTPPPGYVDIAIAPGFAYVGEPTERAAYHGAVRRLVELIREQLNGRRATLPAVPVDLDGDAQIVGRYVHLDVEGITYRVYYEEAGASGGIPVLLQHTAGSDGRQWRHVLSRQNYQSDFRMIAYDLPFHGKSLPPTGEEWWTQDYFPTRTWLFAFLAAFTEKLGLHRPVFMGCSIGGLMAPLLALEQPDRYRAVIAVNGGMMLPYELPPATRESAALDRLPELFFHPRVGNDWKGSGVMRFMAPSGPPSAQRETSWMYASGAPPVFYGDISAYVSQFGISEEQARTIDTSRVGVYFLTGEYDHFGFGGGTEHLAGCVEGSYVHIIESAGHFAPADNPERFREALDPVLDLIRAEEPGTRTPREK